MMKQDDTDNLTALLSVLQAHGVRRFKSGDLEVELAPMGSSEPTAPEKFDPSMCHLCQSRPQGRIAKGLCRECALQQAGVV